ncbi:MAG: AbrB/MazE/SpoVT family DNA-binding domain-containing protein [Leptospirales bacterium]
MKDLEITTLSSKGQVVIPGSIRKELHIEAGSKFAVLTDGDNILLKKIDKPKIQDFKELIKKSRNLVKARGIDKSEVGKVIKNVRKSKSRN